MQLLPRSSTAERMNPYTSMWTGVHAGDGPQEFHLVLLDNGRTQGARRRGRPRRPALHPVQRLPERLPGVRTHRRSRLRLGLSRTDRGDPEPAADRHPWSARPERLAAVCLIVVRRVFRRLPGAHRHPVRSWSTCAPSRSIPNRRRARRPGSGDEGRRVGDGSTDASRWPRRRWRRSGGGQRRQRSPRCPGRAQVDRQPGHSRAARGDLPAMVGRNTRRGIDDDHDARIGAGPDPCRAGRRPPAPCGVRVTTTAQPATAAPAMLRGSPRPWPNTARRCRASTPPRSPPPSPRLVPTGAAVDPGRPAARLGRRYPSRRRRAETRWRSPNSIEPTPSSPAARWASRQRAPSFSTPERRRAAAR